MYFYYIMHSLKTLLIFLCSYIFIICKYFIFMSDNSLLTNVCIVLYPTLNTFLLACVSACLPAFLGWGHKGTSCTSHLSPYPRQSVVLISIMIASPNSCQFMRNFIDTVTMFSYQAIVTQTISLFTRVNSNSYTITAA